MIRLGDLCKTAAGGTPLKSKKEFYEGGVIPWLVSGEVNNKNITSTKRFITQLGLDGSSAKVFPENTVVIAMYGATAGEVGILKFSTSTNQAVCGIYPNETVLPEYVYYFFLSHKSKLVAQAVGNAQPNISQQKIKDTYIDVPPIPEQQRIVAILDQAFADIEKARANAEKNLKNARELFDSYLNQVFSQRGEGWVTTTLESVCKTTQGIQIPKSGQFNEHRQGLRRYLYISDFKTDKSLKYVKDCHPNKLVSENDLVVVNTGNSAGDIFYGINGVLSNNLFKVSFDSSIFVKEYLYHFINSGLFKKHQIGIRKGTANPHMGHENFKSTPFRYPLFYQQQEICKNLDRFSDNINQLESKYHEKLESLDELKKSLLQKAFSGELTKSKGIAA